MNPLQEILSTILALYAVVEWELLCPTVQGLRLILGGLAMFVAVQDQWCQANYSQTSQRVYLIVEVEQ